MGSFALFAILVRWAALIVLNGVKSLASEFGTTIQQQLITVGIVSLIFPNVAQAILVATVDAVRELCITVPNQMLSAWGAAQVLLSQSQWDFALSQLAFSIVQSWGRGLNNLLPALLAIPIVNLIVMIGLGAALGMLMKHLDRHAQASDALPNAQPVARLYNFAFFAILGLATYLSIGAIASISVLQNPSKITEDVSATRLKELLENEREASETAFEDLRSQENPLGEVEKAAAKESDQGFQESVQGWIRFREQIIKMHKDFVASLRKKRDDNISLVITRYQVENMDRIGGRESAKYFLALKDWYTRILTAMETDIKLHADSVEAFESIWGPLGSRLLAAVNEKPVNETPTAREMRIDNVFSEERQSMSAGLNVLLANLKPAPEQYEEPPERPALGSDLGIFSLLASWILRTESLPLALIVGMLGFGLLGSASSTFIREHANRKSGEPLVTDLLGVIVRGLSAAILVFLAVEGGLAVFGVASGGPSPEPNAFVIFLTCLVAAVFSETVWEAASDRLRDALKKGKEENPQNLSDTKVTAPNQTPSGKSSDDRH